MIHYPHLREAIISAGPRSAALAGRALSKETVSKLRVEPYFANLIREMKETAERAIRVPLPALTFSDFFQFSLTGARKKYEECYFERRSRLLALTITTLLEETAAYLETLENLLWEICDEYSWAVPAHLPYKLDEIWTMRIPPERYVDLFAAETAHALSEMLYLIGDRLNPWVTYRVKNEIERRVLQPVFERAESFRWASATNNWSAVCGCAAGMAALLLVDDRERLTGMQDRVMSFMESFLVGYGDDGCCSEGIGYWNYGFGYFIYWAEMLHEYTGGVIDLLQGDKIRRIAQFPDAVMLTGTACVNYSDCEPFFVPNPGLMSRLHTRLGVDIPCMTVLPGFHVDHCYRWPHHVRNLLWTEANLMSVRTTSKIVYFPDAKWLVAKRDSPTGLLAFSAKGGHNDEPHNHNDLGHFILHAGGDTLLADLGMGMYSFQYFAPETRYCDLYNASAGHSVPLVNGCEQAAGRSREASVVQFKTEESGVYLELELASAYPQEAGLSKMMRVFEWKTGDDNHSASLTLTDRFSFEDTAKKTMRSVTEHFISFHKPFIADHYVSWKGKNGFVRLDYDHRFVRAESEILTIIGHDSLEKKAYRVRLYADRLPPQFECKFVFTCGTIVESEFAPAP